MNYSFPKLLETLATGHGLVLATIVQTEGSTPQVAGASALFSKAGLEAGTVGGGVLEARVEAIAREALGDGKARLVTFHLDANPSDLEGAICGGTAIVLIDPGVDRQGAVFAKALEGSRRQRPGYIYTGIRTVDQDVVAVRRRWEVASVPQRGRQPDAEGQGRPAEPDDFPGDISFDPTGSVSWPCLYRDERGLTLIEFVRPLPRLIIAGAGHVGRAGARLARDLYFSVTIIDDRAEFANATNIPEAEEIVVGDIGQAVGNIEYSSSDFFVIVTRGHQKDAEALRAALARPAAYVGMIGSRNKIEIMRREFLRQGWATADQWARVHAPIGLDIGSKTVEEIAVSIAAELVLVRSRLKEGEVR